MQAGRLRHRIALQSNTPTRSTIGSQTDSWSTYATVWGSVEPMKGTEELATDQLNPIVSHLITIRYNLSVVAKHRVLFDSRIFEIISVIKKDSRNIMQELNCHEVAE